jgi:hypothetical protein
MTLITKYVVTDENGNKTEYLTPPNGMPYEEIQENIEEDVYTVLLNKTKSDISFGMELLTAFLADNRATPQAFSTAVNLALLQKFSSTKSFAEVGDIKTCKSLLENTEIDSIFTQSRKDKYVQMCTDYLNTNI